MLPKSAIISSFLAREYDKLLAGSTLIKSEYHRPSKDFRFLFRGERMHHISYSFAPPNFVFHWDWPEKAGPKGEIIAVWLEANDSIVERVSGALNNRIVEVALARERDDGSLLRKRIVFELFGAQSSAFLVDDEGVILQATRVTSDERALKPRKQYVEPEPLPMVLQSGMETIGSDREVTFLLEYDELSFRIVPTPPAEVLDMEYPLTALHAYLERTGGLVSDFAQKQARTLGLVNREIKRNQKTLARSELKLLTAEEAERFKHWGDILMAHQNVTPGADKVTLRDFYSDEEIEIPLPHGKGIIDSATHYYKKAKKLQRSKEPLQKSVDLLKSTISELQRQYSEIAEAEDIAVLDELVRKYGIGIAATRAPIGGQEVASSPYFRVFLSSTGARILVGKSALGNAHLTFKVARNYDLWFHAHQAPGSHVVLMRSDKNHAPAPQAIREAAQLAAAYSGQKKSQAVSVIYTERRHVRKVRKGAPGQVITQNVKSLLVEPGIPPGVKAAE